MVRRSLRALLSLVLLAIVPGVGHAADLSSMQPPEIKALQKRLTDATCCSGPIDGQASPAAAEAVKACPDQAPVLREERLRSRRVSAASTRPSARSDPTTPAWRPEP